MKHFFVALIILSSIGLHAQDYSHKLVTTKLTKDIVIENAINWLLGYSRTAKIKKLKAESKSGESSSGEEDFIHWNSDDCSNLMTSNNVRFKIYNIKYNVHIKIKDNKALIVVKNVFWRNVSLSEKVPYTSIDLAQSKDYALAVMTPGNHEKMTAFFKAYISEEIYQSLIEALQQPPNAYEGW